MLKSLMVVSSLMLSAGFAQAAPFGMAGCGVGALVFGDQPGKVQIVAGVLNNLISPQTSAITSGTSNCYEDQGRASSSMYIETNKVALQEDIARGQGETLSGLLTMWQCEQPSQVGSALHKDYGQIFAAPASAQAIKDSMQNTIRNTKAVAASCQTLI